MKFVVMSNYVRRRESKHVHDEMRNEPLPPLTGSGEVKLGVMTCGRQETSPTSNLPKESPVQARGSYNGKIQCINGQATILVSDRNCQSQSSGNFFETQEIFGVIAYRLSSDSKFT